MEMKRRDFLKALLGGVAVAAIVPVLGHETPLLANGAAAAQPDSLEDVIYRISPLDTPFMDLVAARRHVPGWRQEPGFTLEEAQRRYTKFMNDRVDWAVAASKRAKL
jgi:hypothetical protein